jgi:hypothetical protein
VTLRARWVTLRARWVTLRARWVTLRARWVTPRWVVMRVGQYPVDGSGIGHAEVVRECGRGRTEEWVQPTSRPNQPSDLITLRYQRTLKRILLRFPRDAITVSDTGV